MSERPDKKSEIQRLRSITGSAVRAAILLGLFGEVRPVRTVADLAELAEVDWSAVRREVRRLVDLGLVRASSIDRDARERLYEADPSFPGQAELKRFVLSATGTPSSIRDALGPIDPAQLTWIHGRYALGDPTLRELHVVSITDERRGIRERLALLGREAGYRFAADVMSAREWAQRLHRHEMRVWAIRRAPRMWVVGDDERLRRAEQYELRLNATWKRALENWRDEYEWDDDYDPSKVPLAPTR